MSWLPTKTIEREVVIGASPEQVWQTLTDLARYAQWNPFVTSAAGEASEGTRLTVRIEPPGGKPMTFRPRVLVASPGRELR